MPVEEVKKSIQPMKWVSAAMVAIAGCSWGLTGYPDFALVAMVTGRRSRRARMVYAAMGLLAAGLWGITRRRGDAC